MTCPRSHCSWRQGQPDQSSLSLCRAGSHPSSESGSWFPALAGSHRFHWGLKIKMKNKNTTTWRCLGCHCLWGKASITKLPSAPSECACQAREAEPTGGAFLSKRRTGQLQGDSDLVFCPTSSLWEISLPSSGGRRRERRPSYVF